MEFGYEVQLLTCERPGIQLAVKRVEEYLTLWHKGSRYVFDKRVSSWPDNLFPGQSEHTVTRLSIAVDIASNEVPSNNIICVYEVPLTLG